MAKLFIKRNGALTLWTIAVEEHSREQLNSVGKLLQKPQLNGRMSSNAADHGFHQKLLYIAAGATLVDAMKYHLGENVSPNCPNAAEHTPLNLAITSSFEEAARLLDRRAVNPNMAKAGWDRLDTTHLAASYRRSNPPHRL